MKYSLLYFFSLYLTRVTIIFQIYPMHNVGLWLIFVLQNW